GRFYASYPTDCTYKLNSRSNMGWFDVLCNRATIAHFTVEKFRDLWLHLPSVETQRRIADYLDAETAEIDALIAEKENMLQLLEEKRAALISRIVTRGLDEEVAMKDSGLEWLGKIPVHWKVKRAKQLFFIRDERSETGEEELLTVSHITGVTPRSEKNVYMFKSEDMTGYKLCYSGDLVVNTLWAWMGAMGVASHNGIVSPEYHVYVSKGIILPSYIEMLCRSNPFVAEVIRHSKGVWSSRLRLYPDAFFDIYLPVPPKKEQEDIVNSLASEHLHTSELGKDLKRSIALLKERRSALITAAVTDQLELQILSA
ncbi:MAG: restriction endonuclease subunit S, partial [Gemmatimonadota bacterium]|nr:restriction endonuclease subunit S [Gemmatimonadota bacterium]